MSVLVVLDSQASTRFGGSVLDQAPDHIEYRSAFASHFPYRVAVLVYSHPFKECESVNLPPGQIIEVVCSFHSNIESCVPTCSFPSMKSQMKLRA